MKDISTSQLKTHCSDVVTEVERTRLPITVTRRGRPVARIVPIEDQAAPLFGALRGTVTILGDIIEPVDVEWEAAK